VWLFNGIMIYDYISNYAITVNLGYFTGLFTGIYDIWVNFWLCNFCKITVISQGQCMID
jgi:hypothetical protein